MQGLSLGCQNKTAAQSRCLLTSGTDENNTQYQSVTSIYPDYYTSPVQEETGRRQTGRHGSYHGFPTLEVDAGLNRVGSSWACVGGVVIQHGAGELLQGKVTCRVNEDRVSTLFYLLKLFIFTISFYLQQTVRQINVSNSQPPSLF